MTCELFSFAQECDIPNWLALIIELGLAIPFAIFLTIFFYRRQKKQSDELEKTTKRQEKIMAEQLEFRKKRLEWAVNRLKSIFPDFKENLKALEENATLYRELTKPSQKSKIFEALIEAQEILREHHVDRIERISDQSVGIISPEIIEKIDSIVSGASKKVREVTSKGIQYNQIYYKHVVEQIEDLMKNHLN